MHRRCLEKKMAFNAVVTANLRPGKMGHWPVRFRGHS